MCHMLGTLLLNHHKYFWRVKSYAALTLLNYPRTDKNSFRESMKEKNYTGIVKSLSLSSFQVYLGP